MKQFIFYRQEICLELHFVYSSASVHLTSFEVLLTKVCYATDIAEPNRTNELIASAVYAESGKAKIAR